MLKKGSQGKREPHTALGAEAEFPPQSLKFYYIELPLFIEVCVFWMWFNLNKVSASDALAEISLNELKWTQMSSKELEWA